MFTTDGKVLGLVLDVSLTVSGDRVLDTVKTQLVNFLRKTMDGEDLFYLYHPEVLDPVETVGNMVSTVGNYETDGWLFDFPYAMLQTFFVVSIEDEDYERVVMFITDRIQEDSAVKKLLKLEERDQSGCKFVFVGIGTRYNRKVFENIGANATYRHIDYPNELLDSLLEWRTK